MEDCWFKEKNRQTLYDHSNICESWLAWWWFLTGKNHRLLLGSRSLGIENADHVCLEYRSDCFNVLKNFFSASEQEV